MFNLRRTPQAKPPVKDKKKCKIKIKNTSTGRSIEYEGDCSPEQIDLAKNEQY